MSHGRWQCRPKAVLYGSAAMYYGLHPTPKHSHVPKAACSPSADQGGAPALEKKNTTTIGRAFATCHA